MFAYCTEVLHLSEQQVYLRIAVAHASRRHPTLLAMLRDGRLHLSGIARLAPHLSPEDREMEHLDVASVGPGRVSDAAPLPGGEARGSLRERGRLMANPSCGR